MDCDKTTLKTPKGTILRYQSVTKSPIMWVSVVSIALLVGLDLFGYDILGLTEVAERAVSVFMALVVAFGVINSPTVKGDLFPIKDVDEE